MTRTRSRPHRRYADGGGSVGGFAGTAAIRGPQTGRVGPTGARDPSGGSCPGRKRSPTVVEARSQRSTDRSAAPRGSSRGPTAATSRGSRETTPTEASNPPGVGSARVDRDTREPVGSGLQLAVGAHHAGLPRSTGGIARPAAPWSSARAGRRSGRRRGRRSTTARRRRGRAPRHPRRSSGAPSRPLRPASSRSTGRASLRTIGRDGGGEAADAARQTDPPVGRPRDEVVLLESRDEAVDDGFARRRAGPRAR